MSRYIERSMASIMIDMSIKGFKEFLRLSQSDRNHADNALNPDTAGDPVTNMTKTKNDFVFNRLAAYLRNDD